MTTRSAAEIAQQMAELARELNYATLPQEGYPGLEHPSDVADVAGSLKTMAQRLPQALRQTSLRLGQQAASGRVGHTQGHDPQPYVTEARGGFEEAESAAEALERAMTVAQNSAAGLTGVER